MIEAGLGIYAIAIPALLMGLLAAAEAFWPRRELVLGRHPRWITHALFFLMNAVVGRLLSSILVVGVTATWAADNNFGLLTLLGWPWLIEAAIAFVILDFAVWLQHLAMHHHPLLWRMHAVHHSDRDLDVTTALRFHPFELVVSTLYKSAWVALLGVPVVVALAFELWLNANALFNHSNIRLPQRADRVLRHVLVTPDMHLTHHSILISDQQQNYGFALTIWDRMFGTYAAHQSAHPSGLANAQDDRPAKALWSLTQPFRTFT
jgi:sterol desaturase/sphingolipid hydroxylase (fatty acid hydroxylase superfamily)